MVDDIVDIHAGPTQWQLDQNLISWFGDDIERTCADLGEPIAVKGRCSTCRGLCPACQEIDARNGCGKIFNVYEGCGPSRYYIVLKDGREFDIGFQMYSKLTRADASGSNI